MSLSFEPLPSPNQILTKLPLSFSEQRFIERSREAVVEILQGRSSKLLLIIGPCSIHNITAATEFAKKLKRLKERVASSFEILMRTYFEKPRSNRGWKGLLYDPHLNYSDDLLSGLLISRQFLLDVAKIEVAAATEFLDLHAPHYLADLITWGSIGSRTSESQPHRQLASSLPFPIGFKNGTDGDLLVAINGIDTAARAHSFIGVNREGLVSLLRSKGNRECHIILRGGGGETNYQPSSLFKAEQQLQLRELSPRLIVDCSHDNCAKNRERQLDVFKQVIEQRVSNRNIVGVMLESHLEGGSQTFCPKTSPQPNLSITDPCLDWQTTEEAVLWAHQKLS